jgi:hypothetical protein
VLAGRHAGLQHAPVHGCVMFLRRLTSTRRTCAVCAGKSVCVPRCVRCACVCVCVCVCTAWHVGSGDSLKPRSRASALMCGGLGCCALAAVALPAVCLPPWLHARLRGAPAHQQMLPALLLLGYGGPTCNNKGHVAVCSNGGVWRPRTCTRHQTRAAAAIGALAAATHPRPSSRCQGAADALRGHSTRMIVDSGTARPVCMILPSA